MARRGDEIAHVMWLEPLDHYRSSYLQLTQYLEELGHTVTGLLPTDMKPSSWRDGAHAYIVRTGAYVNQPVLEAGFDRALASGKRVLFLVAPSAMSLGPEGTRRPDDLRAWCDRFGIGWTDEQHHDLGRFDDPGWESRREMIGHLTSYPTEARERLGSLLLGVERVVVDRSMVIRCFDTATPLLSLPRADVVDRDDLLVEPDDLQDDDLCVAAAWSPAPDDPPQVVVVGEVGCLADHSLSYDGNRRFAANLATWLGGGQSHLRLAAIAKGHLDAIELTLLELIVGRLTDAHGVDWWRGLPPNSLRKVRERRPDDPVEQAVDLSDLVSTLRKTDALRPVYQFEGRSRTQSASTWASVIALRHRVAHPGKLVLPVEASDVELLDRLRVHVDMYRRRWFAVRDLDPGPPPPR